MKHKKLKFEQLLQNKTLWMFLVRIWYIDYYTSSIYTYLLNAYYTYISIIYRKKGICENIIIGIVAWEYSSGHLLIF